MIIRVQSEEFDAGAELTALQARLKNSGALVSFTGLVRDTQARDLLHMEIEHYPGMTEKAITTIASEAQDRWNLEALLVVHRYGILPPQAPIMMVATAAMHRVAAFEAAAFLMDYLKSRAPFWKKEIRRGGGDWVAAKDEDENALSRW